MTKRLLTFLALLYGVICYGQFGSGPTRITVGCLFYEYDETTMTAMVKSVNCNNDVTIPAKFTMSDGRTFNVIRIDDEAGDDRDGITSLVISEGITSIGAEAFYQCSLSMVYLPSTITEIGSSAFGFCSELKTIYCNATTPPTATKETFNAVRGNIYVPIGSTAAYTADAAYKYLTKKEAHFVSANAMVGQRLADVVLPAGCSFDNPSAYIQNDGGNIHLGKYVSNGEEYTMIANVTGVFPSTLNVDGVQYNLNSQDKTASVTALPNGKYSGDVVIPSQIYIGGKAFDVKSIEDNAFDGCSDLTMVVIPSNATSIGEYAFRGCTSLSKIVAAGKIAPITSDNAFSGVDIGNVTLYVVIDEFDNHYLDSEFYSQFKQETVNTVQGYMTVSEGTIVNEWTIADVFLPSEYRFIDYPQCGVNEGWPYCGLTSDNTPVCIRPRFIYNPIEVQEDGLQLYYNIDLRTMSAELTKRPDGRQYSGGFTIPETVEYKINDDTLKFKVTTIGDEAFAECRNLYWLWFPEGVTHIGDRAFYNCYNLSSFNFPSTLTHIGAQAFQHTSANAGELKIVSNATTAPTIEDDTFEEFEQRNSRLLVPYESVASYEDGGKFSKLNIVATRYVDAEGELQMNLCDGELPDGCVFDDCKNGSSDSKLPYLGYIGYDGTYTPAGTSDEIYMYATVHVTLPKIVEHEGIVYKLDLDNYTAIVTKKTSGRPYMGDLVLPNSFEVEGTRFDVVGIDDNTFAGYDVAVLRSVKLPEGIKSIGAHAFRGFTGFTSIVLPSTIESIGDSAFYGCTDLKAVVSCPESAPMVGKDAFGNIDSDATVYVPEDMSDSYEANAEFSKLDIEEMMTIYVGATASNYSTLASLTLPTGYAFNEPNDIIGNEEGEFRHLGSYNPKNTNERIPVIIMVEVFPDDVTVGCFSYRLNGNDRTAGLYKSECNSGAVTTPSRITYNGTRFKVENVYDGTFNSNDLISVKLSEGITYIGSYAFENSYNLKTVTLPSTITKINSWAFYNCPSLNTIVSYATTAPVNDYFSGDPAFVGIANTKYVFVPEGCTASYETSNVFKGFQIIEMGSVSVTAIFGQTLADIELPNGYSFDDDLSTSVGDIGTNNFVGKNTIDVSNTLVVTIKVTVTKRPIDFPSHGNNIFTYNTKEQTYEIEENDVYTISGNKKTNAGTYIATVSLKDTSTYMWENKSLADLEYGFIINKSTEIPFPKGHAPEDLKITAVYGQTFEDIEDQLIKDYWWWSYGYGAQIYPDMKVGNVGEHQYRATYQPDDTDNYETLDTYELTVTVVKATVEEPEADKTKFVYNAKKQTYNIEPSNLYSVKGNTETLAGKYNVKVALSDTLNYKWAGSGTVDTLNYNFVIAKAQITEPAADNSKFIYNTQEQTYSIAASELYTVKGDKETNAEEYSVVVSLNDTANYEWKSGKVADLTYDFNIAKAVVDVPEADGTKFVYNGKAQTYDIEASGLYTIDGNVKTDAGEYTVTVTLKDTDNYEWSDGTITNKSYTFNIAKVQVAEPVADNSEFIYNTEVQTYKVAASELYTVKGDKETNAGEYSVVVSLNDTANYEWKSGKVADLTYKFNIAKAVVDVPEADDTKFVYNGKAQTYDIEASGLYTVDGNVKTNAGEYVVTVALKDADNYEWSDKTTANKSYKFNIAKVVVAEPVADNNEFVYDGEEQTYKVAANELYTVKGNVETNAGEYTVIVALNDTVNYEWKSGKVADLEFAFEIAKAVVDIPEADGTKFVYNGKAQTYDIEASGLYTVDGNVKTDAGEYVVTVALKDAKNYQWSDKTTANKSYTFNIAKVVVAEPVADKSEFLYDGEEKTYKVAANELYTVKGNVETNAGEYTVIVALNDTANYEWKSGKVADLEFAFEIAKAVVDIPETDNTKFVYNGKAQTYDIEASGLYTIDGNVKTNAGEYVVTVALKDAKNYQWSDKTTANKSYTFNIAKVVVAEPVADNNEFVYDGEEQTYKVATNELYTVKGNVETNAGVYTVIVALNDTVNYKWESGKVADLEFAFEIAKAVVDIPEADDTKFVYNGKAQTYSIEASGLYTVDGNVKTDAGEYVVTVALKDADNYEWSDKTTANKSYKFNIAKVVVAEPVADNNEFVYDGEEQTYKVAANELYTVKGNVETNAGEYTVIVALNDTLNYEWKSGKVADLEFAFEIAKAVVDIPEADGTKFVYNGKAQTYDIEASGLYTVDGNVKTNAGEYVVTVALKDAKNYEWSDKTTANKSYKFNIAKIVVAEPVADNNKFVYDGEEKTYKVAASELYTVKGNVETNAGEYTVIVALNDTLNYEWKSGKVADLEFAFEIAKAVVDIPEADGTKFVYNGKAQTYDIEASGLYTIDGNVKTNAGEYVVTVALKDTKNYEWTNGSNKDLNYTFTISAMKIDVPVASNTSFVYDGKAKVCEIIENGYYTISGNSATNAGEYTAIVSLVSPNSTTWADGTTTDIKIGYTIEKAKVAIPEEDNSIFVYTGELLTYTIQDSEFYTVDGNKQSKVGEHTVTITLKDTANYAWANDNSDDLKYKFVIEVSASIENAESADIDFYLSKVAVRRGEIFTAIVSGMDDILLENCSILVYDANGKLISVENTVSDRTEISINNIGLHIVALRSNDGKTMIKRVIVK